MNHTATYSPDDNKLRLYPASRLGAETYARVKAAGFKWAPKQELFVAPMWTPKREDLLIELCGEIGDEDTSLGERAEERAERFEDYSEKRAAESERAQAAVEAIADQIPLGQPILTGHHSEKRARKDKERIESGMRKAVKAWKTSQYWLERAAGALSHAKYKERADVRHRRIKTLESELRKCKAAYTPANDPPHIIMQQAYSYAKQEYLFDGKPVPHVWVGPKGRGGQWVLVESLPHIKEQMARWEEHYENRIAYEKAMLGEQGGLKADAFDLKVGGQILTNGLWLTITKINKSGGVVSSVSTNNRSWPRVVPVERIKDYKAPTEEAVETVKKATKLPPICNYPGSVLVARFRDGSGYGSDPTTPTEIKPITKAEWDRCHKDYKGTRVVAATETAGSHRVRVMFKGGKLEAVYLSDDKRKDPPKPDGSGKPKLPPVEQDLATLEREAQRRKERQEEQAKKANPVAKLEEALKAGVKVVVAPQLFPTPPELARRVVNLADIQPDVEVLEPSAGMGALIEAFRPLPIIGKLVMVEYSDTLAEALRNRFPNADVRWADFLGCDSSLGSFDRIVMNPPFKNAEDIKHIRHAMTFLKKNGRLVSICANGPRQREQLMPLATEWIDLPEGSFKEAGTNVNAAIFVYDKENDNA